MKTNTLSAAIGNIGDKYIARSESSSPARKNHFIRYAAAAAAILLVLGAVFAAVKLLPANAPKQEAAIPSDDTSAWLSPVEIPEDAILPVSRLGTKGKNHPDIVHFASDVDEAFTAAGLVCVGTVGNCLGEKYGDTFFEVNVERVYKGKQLDKLVIGQYGTSEWGGMIPLFTYGDRLLLFLISNEPYKDTHPLEWENAYWIGGACATVFDIILDDDGTPYICDIMGVMGEKIRRPLENLKDDENGLIDRLRENMSEYDDCAKYRNFEYVYRFDDFEDCFLNGK